MHFITKRAFIRLLLALMFFVVSGIPGTSALKAQEGVNVTIKGTLQAINGDGTIIVNGTTYKLGNGVILPASAQIGTVVKLTGHFVNDQLVVVIVIVDTAPSTAPATATPAATPPATEVGSADLIVVVAGPVAKINLNIITIYDINVSVAPDHPLLKVIHVGDFLRAKGAYNTSGVLVASFITNVLDTANPATVSLDGKVESINGTVIVVNGFTVQLAAGDPILIKLKVGDLIHLDGNFQGSGTTVIIVVVKIVVVNDVVIVRPGLPPGCKMSKNGHIKCSKKGKKH